METSQELDKLAAAMAKAQAEMAGAKKDSDNPFFKSKYADLTSVWIACKEAFHNNGFSVIQSPIHIDGRIGVTTLLLHESGQYVKDSFTLGVKKQNDPQADGSCITYARRYSLAAFAGVCPEDDDGERGMQRNEKIPDSKEAIYTAFCRAVGTLETIEALDGWAKDNQAEIKKQLGKTEYLDMLREDIRVRKGKIAGEILTGGDK